MEFHDCATAIGLAAGGEVRALIAELGLLIDQRSTDPLATELACRDLESAPDVCDDAALAADARDLVAQATPAHVPAGPASPPLAG